MVRGRESCTGEELVESVFGESGLGGHCLDGGVSEVSAVAGFVVERAKLLAVEV